VTASPARPPAVLQPVVFAVDGEVGWRHALLDADWMAWVCPRGHRTRQEADGCREKNGLHPEQMEAARQSRLVASSPRGAEDQAFIDAISAGLRKYPSGIASAVF